MTPLTHRFVTRGATLALGGLLILLGSLQYRWMGEVSLAESERMRASLAASTRRLTEDFDEELARLSRNFFLDPRQSEDRSLETNLVEGWRDWQVESAHSELLGNLYLAKDSATLHRLTPEGELVAIAWSAKLEPARAAIETAEHEVAGRWEPGRNFPFGPLGPLGPVLLGEVPAVLLPILAFDERRSRNSIPVRQGWVLLELDRAYIEDVFLPELADRYFVAADGLDYALMVVSRSEDVIYRYPAEAAPSFDQVDASVPLFSMHRLRGLVGPPRGSGPGPRRPRDLDREGGRERGPRRRSFGGAFRAGGGGMRDPGEGEWRLLVRHRAGSLEAAVTKARRRNLAINFGILAVLGASLVMIVLSSRRAMALSSQKMKFVAGVSHELRTPLAVIRSAGQNLADGSVADPTQVRRYGALVEKEGRRLSSMVDQVLELAGIQSERQTHAPRSVPLVEIVEKALADYESLIEERGIEVETRFPDASPRVQADPESLLRAVQNLIANAIKHGGEGRWLGVTVTGPSSRTMPELRVTIRDRGPGIPARERGRLFDALYRGEEAVRAQRPGSGLGLSLVKDIVERHGGRIEIESKVGEGTAFTILLPPEKGA